MAAKRVVYVLETGCYDQAGISGVFATPEAAMAAWTPKPGAVKGREYGESAGTPWSYEWEKVGDSEWRFGADWDDAARVTEFEVTAPQEVLGVGRHRSSWRKQNCPSDILLQATDCTRSEAPGRGATPE